METIEPVPPSASPGGKRGMKALRAALFGVQLAVALPLLWWALLPRLGPLEWSLFILLAGMFSSLAAPLLAAGNAVWLAGRWLRGVRPLDRAALAATVVWAGVAVLAWTGFAITPIRPQLAEAGRFVAAAHRCRVTSVDWYERGAEVYCERTPAPRGEVLRIAASNGPFPWSPWRTELLQRQLAWVTEPASDASGRPRGVSFVPPPDTPSLVWP